MLTGLLLTELRAQAWEDSLRIDVESFVLAATNDYQPFWLLSNRWGIIPDRPDFYALMGGLHNAHNFGGGRNRPGLTFRYGASVLAGNRETLLFPEYYMSLETPKWQIKGGRWQQTSGALMHELSSGSLGISRNALPLPRVQVGTNDFIRFEFMPEWLRFRGHMAHGWFGDNRIVDNTWLHEKTFYLKVGEPRSVLNIWAGVTHFAMWGGEHPEGTLPDRMIDFVRISTGFPQNAGDSDAFDGPGDTAGALGNHLAVADLGLSWQANDYRLALATQTLFEKGRDATRSSRGEIRGFNLLGPDRLVSLSVETPHPWWEKAVLEFVNTTYQGGSELFVGRDHFYDNAIYRDGWNYREQVMGNPLLLHRRRVSKFFDDDAELGNWDMVNNRIRAWHTAMSGRLGRKLGYELKLTYTQNYGNYTNTELFTPTIRQWYSMLETEYRFSRQLSVAVTGAYDAGGFGNNLGGMLSLKWQWNRETARVRYRGYRNTRLKSNKRRHKKSTRR